MVALGAYMRTFNIKASHNIKTSNDSNTIKESIGVVKHTY